MRKLLLLCIFSCSVLISACGQEEAPLKEEEVVTPSENGNQSNNTTIINNTTINQQNSDEPKPNERLRDNYLK